MRRIVLITAGIVVALLVAAQLFLPGIAAQRLRERLSHSGQVLSVQVSAFPAIELLWHHADKVVVRLASYRSGTGKLSSLLNEAAGVGQIDASATQLSVGLLTLRDATLTKRAGTLTASASIAESDLRASVPFLQSVTPVASGGGQLTLRGTATVLGVSAVVDATVAAHDGSLLVAPDVPLGSLATLTVFSDPHVAVQSVSATGTADGFSVAARAQLH